MTFPVEIVLVCASAALVSVAVVLAPPQWVFTWCAKRSGGLFLFANTRDKVVALTIDDGPDSDGTEPILDELQRHGAQATFFLIGNRLEGNGHLVDRMVAEGHELGNHLLEDRPAAFWPKAVFLETLSRAHCALQQFGEVAWFRPPCAMYSKSMLDMASGLGYRSALGSVYPYDAQLKWPGFSRWFVLWNVRPGAIVVLHDGPGRGLRTAAALREILPTLAKRGYRVVTLSGLLGERETDALPVVPPEAALADATVEIVPMVVGRSSTERDGARRAAA